MSCVNTVHSKSKYKEEKQCVALDMAIREKYTSTHAGTNGTTMTSIKAELASIGTKKAKGV